MSISNPWLGNDDRPVTLRNVYRRIRTFILQSYLLHLVLPLTAQYRQQLWSGVSWAVFSVRFYIGMRDDRTRARRDNICFVEKHTERK